jgi:hypothetical protein
MNTEEMWITEALHAEAGRDRLPLRFQGMGMNEEQLLGKLFVKYQKLNVERGWEGVGL